jgi:hypothetical protein
MRNGINVTGSIVDGGGLLNFYSYNHIMMLKDQSVGYLASNASFDLPIYLISGTWHFPLWLIERFTDINTAETILGVMYSKSLYLLFAALTACITNKICVQIGICKQNALWASFIFMSSLLTLTAFVIGNSDIIGVFFIMCGVKSLLSKKHMAFVAFFALSITFKMYAAFVFLPLLLLFEKRVRYVLRDSSLAFLPLAVSRFFIMPYSPGGSTHDSFFQRRFHSLFARNLPLMEGVVSVLVLIFLLICIYCFLTIPLKEDRQKFIIYMPLLTMVGVFISYRHMPYAFIYMAPFLSIITCYNISNAKNNLLFETAGLVLLIFYQFTVVWWCYDVTNVFRAIWGLLLPEGYQLQEWLPIEYFAHTLWGQSLSGAFSAGFIVCMVTFLFMNWPAKLKTITNNAQSQNITDIRVFCWIRLLANSFVAFIPVMLAIYMLFRLAFI